MRSRRGNLSLIYDEVYRSVKLLTLHFRKVKSSISNYTN